MALLPEGMSPQSLHQYLSRSQDALKEDFTRIKEKEKERVQHEGSFVDHPIAKSRDRYPSIRAFANNRIRVEGSSHDYLNASLAEIGDSKFIATQNPTYPIEDFWTMVLDQNVPCIVMLMRPEGDGKDRAARYFPRDTTDSLQFRDISITLVEDARAERGTEVRELRVVRGGGEARTIWHLSFLCWPDMGIPPADAVGSFLNLIKLSRSILKPNLPRLVHCSAGVGRTGTFIALDYLLEELERGALLDNELEMDPVFETVDYLREKRIGMVFTQSQYQFIHDTLRWRLDDMSQGGDVDGTNRYWTFFIGGPKKSDSVPKWRGIPQRTKLTNAVDVENQTKLVSDSRRAVKGTLQLGSAIQAHPTE